MNNDHFVKVFDVLDSGFKDWGFSAFGLPFLFYGLISLVLRRGQNSPSPRIFPSWQIFPSPRRSKLYGYGTLGFAVLWTVAVFFGTFSEYRRHSRMAREGSCRVVEGPVEDFVPMPKEGHANESFSVRGVRFSYSDFKVTDAFNNAASRGGPLNSDSYVRICYDPAGNAILRLEVRGFAGKLKDYGSFFENFQGWGND